MMIPFSVQAVTVSFPEAVIGGVATKEWYRAARKGDGIPLNRPLW
jgi:hypothetical protein